MSASCESLHPGDITTCSVSTSAPLSLYLLLSLYLSDSLSAPLSLDPLIFYTPLINPPLLLIPPSPSPSPCCPAVSLAPRHLTLDPCDSSMIWGCTPSQVRIVMHSLILCNIRVKVFSSTLAQVPLNLYPPQPPSAFT